MGMWLSPVQEPAPVPGTDLPPQSILKSIFCSSHCLVNIAGLGQGHLADNLWWSRTLKPSLGSVDRHACLLPRHLGALREEILPMEGHGEGAARVR